MGGYRRSSKRQYARKTSSKIRMGKARRRRKARNPEFKEALSKISSVEHNYLEGGRVADFLKKFDRTAPGLIKKVEFKEPDTIYVSLDSQKKVSGRQLAKILSEAAVSLNPDEAWIEGKGKTTRVGLWWD